MAEHAVAQRGLSIRLACQAFQISQACYRYKAQRCIEDDEIYLKAYDSVRAARNGIAQYLQFYNAQRPHQAHGQATPDEAYFAALPFAKMQAA